MVGNNKIVKGLFWVYLENISVQLVNFIITIILARLLEPSLYGEIALINVFISLAAVFVKSSFSSALIQKKDADEKDYSTMFWFNQFVAVVLYLLMFLLAPYLSKYYNNEHLTILIRVLALSIPLSGFNSIQLAYVSSHMVFKKSFIASSGGTLLSGIISVVMAFCGFGIWALVAQRVLYVLFDTLFLRLVVRWNPSLYFSFNRLKPMLSFGWKLLVTGFMFTAYNEIRSLIIGKRYSPAELGYYDRGFSFPRFIASDIDATINRVLFPALSKEQDCAASLALKTRRAAKTSAYIMTPILIGLASIAHPLVLFLLGEKWLPCVPYLQIMCLVWWLQPTQSCSTQAIKSIGRSDVYLYIEIISKIIGLALLAYAVFVIDTVMAIAVTMLISQVIAMVIYGISSHKLVGYKFVDQLKDLLVPLFFSAVMCVALYFVELFVQNNILCIILQVTTGIAIYVSLSVLFKCDSFTYILNALNIKRK